MPAPQREPRLLDLPPEALGLIFAKLTGSPEPYALAGRALVRGRDAFRLATTCRALLAAFRAACLRGLHYAGDAVPRGDSPPSDPAHVAALVALAGPRLRTLALAPYTTRGAPHFDVAPALAAAAAACANLRALRVHLPAVARSSDCFLADHDAARVAARRAVESLGPALSELAVCGVDSLFLACVAAAAGVSPRKLLLMEVHAGADDLALALANVGGRVDEFAYSPYPFPVDFLSASYDHVLALLPRHCPRLTKLWLGPHATISTFDGVARTSRQHVSFPPSSLARSLDELHLSSVILPFHALDAWAGCMSTTGAVFLTGCCVEKDGFVLPPADSASIVSERFQNHLTQITGVDFLTMRDPDVMAQCPQLKAISLDCTYPSEGAATTTIADESFATLGKRLEVLDLSKCDNMPAEELMSILLLCPKLASITFPIDVDLGSAELLNVLNFVGKRMGTWRNLTFSHQRSVVSGSLDVSIILRNLSRFCPRLETIHIRDYRPTMLDFRSDGKMDKAIIKRRVQTELHNSLSALTLLEERAENLNTERLRSEMEQIREVCS